MAALFRAARTPLLWIVVAIAVICLVDRSATFQNCIGHSNDEMANRDHATGISNLFSFFDSYRECTGVFVTDNHDAITALATLFIALFTLTLWISTRSLWRAGEIHSARELRAYIAVIPGFLGDINPTLRMFGVIGLANVGRTPARWARHATVLRIEQHPLPPNFPFPDLSGSPRNSRFDIAPGMQAGGNVVADNTFSQAQIVEFFQAPAQGGRRLYVFGQIDFTDIFDEPRWVRFCASFQGNHDLAPIAQQGDWAEIKRRSTQPGFGFAWELAPQHNESN